MIVIIDEALETLSTRCVPGPSWPSAIAGNSDPDIFEFLGLYSSRLQVCRWSVNLEYQGFYGFFKFDPETFILGLSIYLINKCNFMLKPDDEQIEETSDDD